MLQPVGEEGFLSRLGPDIPWAPQELGTPDWTPVEVPSSPGNEGALSAGHCGDFTFQLPSEFALSVGALHSFLQTNNNNDSKQCFLHSRHCTVGLGDPLSAGRCCLPGRHPCSSVPGCSKLTQEACDTEPVPADPSSTSEHHPPPPL